MERCEKLLVCFFAVLICISGFVVADDECVYTLFASTATGEGADTESDIGVELFNANGEVITISNLVTWGGLMGSDHDYFEKGNVDIFSGRGTCLYSPICGINITNSLTGDYPGWFCNYISVTYAGADIQCHQEEFNVSRWVSSDVVTINNCNNYASDASHMINKNPKAAASSRFRSSINLLFPQVA